MKAIFVFKGMVFITLPVSGEIKLTQEIPINKKPQVILGLFFILMHYLNKNHIQLSLFIEDLALELITVFFSGEI